MNMKAKDKKTKSESVKKQAKQILSKTITNEQRQEYLHQRIKFIDKFTLCDVTCKTVLEAYKKLKKASNEEIKLALDMRVIPYAFAMFDIEIDRNVLNRIFGGSKIFKRRGSKSAKKLRDGIIHAMNSEDLAELYDRYQELMQTMDIYLNLFLDKERKTENDETIHLSPFGGSKSA